MAKDIDDADGFIASGPVPIGFACLGARIDWGGWMKGRELGVFSQGPELGPLSEPGDVPFGVGVFGTSRDAPGVWGTSFGPFGVQGQLGDAGPSPLPKAGVFGTANNDYGIIGTSTRRPGIWGHSEDDNGVVATSTNSFGVVAQSGNGAALQIDRPAAILATSSQRIAVSAVSNAVVAVHAHSGAPHNFGLFKTGAVTATSSGPFHGVSALSLNFDAVHGSSSGSNGVTGLSGARHGVEGLSFAPPRAPGVKLADAPAGVRGQSMNGSIGVLGVADSPTATSGAGVVGVGSPHAPAGFFEGDLHVTGQIFAGIKDAIVPFPDGSKRLLHCMESPEHWFEDFGSARLTRGRVTVKLDADFAKVVTLNGYRVFLTPEGDCQGLYVRSKRGTSFEVRELQGGTSNVAFSYRIVARRKDIKAHTRFAKIDTRLPIPTGKARAARGRQAARALLATLAKDAKIETTVPMPTGKARAARGRQAARLPSSIRALIAATALPIHTRKVRAARGRKAALPSSIRALLAEQRKLARKTRRKPAVRG